MNAGDSRIAVIMPAFNVAPFIEQAIESVLAQRTPVPYRLYIADDCSTDSTREICRRYAERYPERITLVCNPRNLGLPMSFSQIHNQVPEDYFCVLDGDDYFTDPDKLAMQFDLLERRPEVTVCAHNARRVLEPEVTDPTAHPPYVVDPSVPERDFTVSELARGAKYPGTPWTVYFATSTMMYRNLFKHRVPEYFYQERGSDEIIRTIVHCQYGPLAYVPRVMSAWRIRPQSRWNGLRFRKQMFKLVDDCAHWNEILGYRFDRELTERSSEHVRREVLGWKLALRYPINPLFFGGLTYRGLRNLSAYWWRQALARPSHPLEPLEPSPARQAD
jgi:glycosyltransferase involved in cell wall biosynthesis